MDECDDAGRAPPSDTLDLQTYVPYFIRAIANKLGQAATKEYGELFGTGLNEWACLALLARESDITAGRISEVSGHDKAVISRSLSSLVAKGHVSSTETPNHNRRRILRLTDTGWQLYRDIHVLALAREEKLLKGVAPEDRAQLLRILPHLYSNVQNLA